MNTIAAISTAPGIGGIGIIRMSGEDCFKVLEKIFKPKSDSEIKGYTIKYGNIVDGKEIRYNYNAEGKELQKKAIIKKESIFMKIYILF